MGDITQGTIFTLNQQNINAPQMNGITGNAVINPSFVSGKPSSTGMAPADTLLMYSQSGANLKQVPFSVLSTQIQGQAQNGSFNALHNGDMAVNQSALYLINNTGGTGGAMFTTLDRWRFQRNTAATLRPAFLQNNVGTPNGSFITPNPPFNWYLNITPSTTQGTLSAGDFGIIRQGIENTYALPLLGNPMSLSFLYNTNVAGTFFISFQDSTQANSYVTPFTTVGDSAWHLATIPNIPAPASGPNFGLGLAEGNLGMLMNICLGSGTTFQTSTQNAWQAGNFLCGTTQTNFWNGAANFLNLTQFMLNPGAACSPFVSIPFANNLATCQRYYCQAKNYGVNPYSATAFGALMFFQTTTLALGWQGFPTPMALVPTVTLGCSASTGQVDSAVGGALRVATAGNVSTNGFSILNGTGLVSTDAAYYAQYTATCDY